MATDIALSEDGKFFYLCRPAPGDGLTSFILDKWQLLPDGPKLIGQTSAPINEEQNSAWETLNEGDTVPLIPARDPSAHSKPAAFLENGNYLRTGTQFMENPLLKQGSLPEHIAGGLLTEFWEEASRQGNYVAVTRRMRLQAPLNPEQEEARQKHLRDQVQKIYKKLNWYPDWYHDWYPERKAVEQRKILGEHTDFDDLPEDVGPPASEEHDDLEAMSNASSNESDGHTEETESIDSFSSDHGDEDESPEDDIRSLSDSESVESGGSRWTSSSIASAASSVRSTESLKRMHTRDMMESSTNDAYFSELIRSHEYKKCDGCGFSAYRWLHCFECHASDLDLCTKCSAEGGWCRDKSHPLLEADHNGPVTMRRFSNWTLGHQLRIWDTSKDEDFIFQVQYFSDERILHSSQPVLHPTAPVVAWALSPTKIVLAYFGEDEDEVSQRMRPFSEGGRRISVDLKFSPCGSYLLVASVEASRQQEQTVSNAEKGQSKSSTLKLSIQVAVLRVRFKNEVLKHPIPLCERHFHVPSPVPSAGQTIPYAWTWTPTDVFFILTTSSITVCRFRIEDSENAHLSLGPVDTTLVSIPPQHQHSQWKAQVIVQSMDQSPLLVLMPIQWTDESHPPAPQYLTISDQWKAVRVEEQTRAAANKYKVSYPTPGSVAHNPDTADLNVVRSEIRLLYLLPGSGDDPIRCKISKVSLDDLERAKSRLLETFGKINDEPEHRTSQHDEDDDPDFVPTVIDRVDFSDPANANLTVYDIMTRSQAAKDILKETSPLTIRYENIDERQGALVSAIMEDRKQKDGITFSRGLPPAYNYEALSYLCVVFVVWMSQEHFGWTHCVLIDNIAERNCQVQMMGRIYKSAASVVIWLGDTDDIPLPAVSVIDQATDPVDETDTAKHGDQTENDKALTVWRENVLRDALSKASPPWWTRSWIIQELVLASELSVAFGPAEVSWSTFYSDLLDTWKSIPELSRIFSLRLNRDRGQYNGSLGETALLARDCAATDPRDKIYSILSLVKPEQATLMKPDYGLQEAEIFTQATFTDIWCNITHKDAYDEALTVWHSKGSHGKHPRAPRYPVFSSYGDKGTHQTGLRPDRFRILNWAKPTASRMEGLPSWAVDFSDRTCFSEDAHFRLGGERWTFDGNSNLHERASIEMSADQGRLTVRGVIFDRVENVLPEIPVRDYRTCEANMNARLASIFSQFPTENPYTAATGISGTAKLRTDSLRRVMRPNWIITHAKRNMISVSYQDQATQVLSHWDPSERPKVDWSGLEDVRYSDCEVEGCHCGPSRLFKAWDRSVSLSEDARDFMSPDFEKCTSPWDNYCPTLKGDAGASRDPSDPLSEEDTGFLLTTKTGFLGVARASIRPGDVIALFYGSDVPVVLRPIDASMQYADRAQYTYEGRAWVNGIMQGELWNVYEDPMLEIQDFEIW